MSRKMYGALAAVAAASLILTACSSSDDTATDAATAEATVEETVEEAVEEVAGGAGGNACVILPDSQSSDRWENQDRPAIQAALESAGFTADIQNAQGDTNQYLTIGDQMLATGCGVMILVDLNGSGATVAEKAKAQGNEKKIKQAEEALAARRSWLETLTRSAKDLA